METILNIFKTISVVVSDLWGEVQKLIEGKEVVVYSVSAFLLVLIIFLIVSKLKNKKYLKIVNELERKRISVLNSPVMYEISKLSFVVKNRKTEIKIEKAKDEWAKVEKHLSDVISEKILDLEGLIEKKDYKKVNDYIEEVEALIEVNSVKAEELLKEITEISNNEEASRQGITEVKSRFRDVKEKFKTSEHLMTNTSQQIQLRFDDIGDKIIEVEELIQRNDYTVVDMLMHSLYSNLEYCEMVVNKLPDLILMSEEVVPKKLEYVKKEFKRCEALGINLDYLNFDYSYKTSMEKLDEIIEKIKSLDLNYVEIELKAIVKYCESIFSRLAIEENSYNNYNELVNSTTEKVNSAEEQLKDLQDEVEDVSNKYDYTDVNLEDFISILNQNKSGLHVTKEKITKKEIPFSESEEIFKSILNNVSIIQDELSNILNELHSLRDDERRAYEQLEQMQIKLIETKNLVRTGKLPIIPYSYHIYLKDAVESLNNLVQELNSVPLDIRTINVRVGTARDLSIKFYNYTRTFVKEAFMAENSILYGNRYRSSYNHINRELELSTRYFNEGKYRESITTSMEALERIEPGIYQRLNEYFSNNVKETASS